MRAALLAYLIILAVPATAQPRAVQIFTVTEYVNIFLNPGELSIDQQGKIWMGSGDKLISFDGFHYTSYPLPAGIYPYNDHSQLAFNYQAQNGTYWAFIHNNGLYGFNPSNKQFTAFPFSDDILQQLDIHRLTGKLLLEDSRGNIWISLNGYGLLGVNTQTKQQSFYPIHDSTQANDFISASWLTKGIELKDGSVYFGTNMGLVTFDNAKRLVIFKEDDPKFDPSNSCIITGLAEGNGPGELVISSWGTAIKKFNTHTKRFSTFLAAPYAAGKFVNVINDLIKLTDSTYFFVKRDTVGQAGFGIFNSRTNRYSYLKELEPGYITREYFSMVRSGDYIWVANINQLYRFWLPALTAGKALNLQTVLPGSLKQPLDLYMDHYWVNEQERNIPGGLVSLGNNENNLRFVFSCKNATMYDSVLFSYRLKGYEKNWHSSYSPVAQYNSVGHGQYTFEARIEKSPFVFSNTTISVPLKIAALWWQTWWFKLFVGLLLLGLIAYVYRVRIRSIEERAKLAQRYEKRIAEVEMKALRAQMNPHFIFNCLNSINRYIVKSDHVTASNYLTKFSKLIRLILDNSAFGIISLQTEKETLELYLQMEAMRFEQRFNYSIVVDKELDQVTTLLPSLLIQPYIENAIWHGLLHKTNGEAILKIEFIKRANTVEITVEDNGIGRAMAAQLKSKEAVHNTSRGLQITRDRIELIKNLYDISAAATITDLVNTDGSAAGTRVLISVPLLKSQTIAAKHD